jgi:hypothetical protein
MGRNRNLIVTILINGLLAFQVMDRTVLPPPDKPDLWRVLNNLLSLLFFILMAVYVHFKMRDEAIKHSKDADKKTK